MRGNELSGDLRLVAGLRLTATIPMRGNELLDFAVNRAANFGLRSP